MSDNQQTKALICRKHNIIDNGNVIRTSVALNIETNLNWRGGVRNIEDAYATAEVSDIDEVFVNCHGYGPARRTMVAHLFWHAGIADIDDAQTMRAFRKIDVLAGHSYTFDDTGCVQVADFLRAMRVGNVDNA